MSEDLVRRKKRLSEAGQHVPCPIWMLGDRFKGFQGPDAWVIEDPSQTYALYDSPRAGGVFRLDQYSFDRSDDGSSGWIGCSNASLGFRLRCHMDWL